MAFDERKPTQSTWVDIGAVEDLPPGTMKRYDLEQHRILVANVEGAPLAVADTCTHEDASLSMGALQGDKVKCPLHGSRFCLKDGRALDEPAEIDLERYPARFTDGRLEVAFSCDVG
ncbi:MAG: non-heme iron oxygenase ferredoxin subunit [Proteobacteria bacterium]|jgi:nitrite reductase/ring-hydroxylating ferredoxin subunit|nr:non-heme iron oxygenase ferredoxin subunit [Pseudomonadota bacterium]MBT5817039.1 non-heme iron oxygenase ferredoxin subunit [Pseudomonadota bacterium]MBT6350231.1 non-heme iron oxygenase ferredoxin subunit [Pseudomonadota bacterium]